LYYFNTITGKPVPHAFCQYFSDGNDQLRAEAGKALTADEKAAIQNPDY